jgi:hypothetical protein
MASLLNTAKAQVIQNSATTKVLFAGYNKLDGTVDGWGGTPSDEVVNYTDNTNGEGSIQVSGTGLENMMCCEYIYTAGFQDVYVDIQTSSNIGLYLSLQDATSDNLGGQEYSTQQIATTNGAWVTVTLPITAGMPNKTLLYIVMIPNDGSLYYANSPNTRTVNIDNVRIGPVQTSATPTPYVAPTPTPYGATPTPYVAPTPTPTPYTYPTPTPQTIYVLGYGFTSTDFLVIVASLVIIFALGAYVVYTSNSGSHKHKSKKK